MKRLVVLAVVALAFSQVALFAQDAPKMSVFGGYSFVNADAGTARLTSHGWSAAYEHTLADMWGFVADFGGHYKNGVSTFEYTFGPRANFRSDKATVFAHALFGSTHASAGTLSSNAFTMAYGGGVDVKASDSMDIRVVQFDWMPSRAGGVWANDTIRLGFGVVFKAKK